MEVFTLASFVSKKISLRTKVWGRREVGMLDASCPGELLAYSFKGILAEHVVLQAAGPIHLKSQDECLMRGVVERLAGPEEQEIINFQAALHDGKTGELITDLKIDAFDAKNSLLVHPRMRAILWRCRALHPMIISPPSNTRLEFESTPKYFKFTETNSITGFQQAQRTDCLAPDSKSSFLRIDTDPDAVLSRFGNIYCSEFPAFSYAEPPCYQPMRRILDIAYNELGRAVVLLNNGIELESVVDLLANWQKYIIKLLLQFAIVFPKELAAAAESFQSFDQRLTSVIAEMRIKLEEAKTSETDTYRKELVSTLVDELEFAKDSLTLFLGTELETSTYRSFEAAVPNFIEIPDEATRQAWIEHPTYHFCVLEIKAHLAPAGQLPASQVHFKNLPISSIMAAEHSANWTGTTEDDLQVPLDRSLLKASTKVLAPLQRDAKFELAAVRAVRPETTQEELAFNSYEIPELGEDWGRTNLTIFKTTHQAIYVERVVNRQIMEAGRYFILRAPIANLKEVEVVSETPSGGRFDLASETGLDVLIAADSILHFHRTHRRTKKVISKGTIKLWDFIEDYLDRIKSGWDVKEFNEAYRLTKIILRGVKYDEVSVCIGVCQGLIFLHIFSGGPDSEYNIHLFCQIQPTSAGSLRVLRLIEQKIPTDRNGDDDAPGGIGGHGLYTITFSARKTYFYVIESYIYSGNNQYLYYFKPGKSTYPGKLRLPNEFRALSSGWRIFPYVNGMSSKKTRLLAYRTQGRHLDFKPRSTEERQSTKEPEFWFEEQDTTPAVVQTYYTQPRIQSFLMVVLEFS